MQPVKAIFNELFADGIIASNPASRLGKLKEKRVAIIDRTSIKRCGNNARMPRALTDQKAISYLRYGYVFVSEKGQPLDISNFRARIWSPALKKAGLKYRYPYQAVIPSLRST